MSVILFGIPNCDTVKKALDWLAEHGCAYQFHDFKKDGLTHQQITHWLQAVPWDVLINKKGLTWRNLPDAKKIAVVDAASATALMLASSSVIKRPVLCTPQSVLVGFSADLYQQQLRVV